MERERLDWRKEIKKKVVPSSLEDVGRGRIHDVSLHMVFVNAQDRWIEATLLGILLLQTVALSLFPTDEGWSMPVRSILSWIAFLRPASVSQQMHTSLSILWILVVVISLCSWMIIHYASVSLLESDSLARAHIESPFEFEPLRIAREEWETCPKGNQVCCGKRKSSKNKKDNGVSFELESCSLSSEREICNKI